MSFPGGKCLWCIFWYFSWLLKPVVVNTNSEWTAPQLCPFILKWFITTCKTLLILLNKTSKRKSKERYPYSWKVLGGVAQTNLFFFLFFPSTKSSGLLRTTTSFELKNLYSHIPNLKIDANILIQTTCHSRNFLDSVVHSFFFLPYLKLWSRVILTLRAPGIFLLTYIFIHDRLTTPFLHERELLVVLSSQ